MNDWTLTAYPDAKAGTTWTLWVSERPMWSYALEAVSGICANKLPGVLWRIPTGRPKREDGMLSNSVAWRIFDVIDRTYLFAMKPKKDLAKVVLSGQEAAKIDPQFVKLVQ